jgi:hypothetical protein
MAGFFLASSTNASGYVRDPAHCENDCRAHGLFGPTGRAAAIGAKGRPAPRLSPGPGRQPLADGAGLPGGTRTALRP